jgi:hypothetical protein
MIVHNGLGLNDVELEWVTPRVLRIDFAWPEWFTYAEQMASFSVDEEGNIMFPPEHALTQDMAAYNSELIGEDGKVWDTGYIKFNSDMDTDDGKYMFELLEIDLSSQGKKVNQLQIFCQAKHEDATSKRGGVKAVRTVKLGTGPRASDNNENTRRLSEREEYEGNMDTGDDRNTRARTAAG